MVRPKRLDIEQKAGTRKKYGIIDKINTKTKPTRSRLHVLCSTPVNIQSEKLDNPATKYETVDEFSVSTLHPTKLTHTNTYTQTNSFRKIIRPNLQNFEHQIIFSGRNEN